MLPGFHRSILSTATEDSVHLSILLMEILLFRAQRACRMMHGLCRKRTLGEKRTNEWRMQAIMQAPVTAG